jgi:hypothetical protein
MLLMPYGWHSGLGKIENRKNKMSSRDTFVTSYIYNGHFRNGVWDILSKHAYTISDRDQNWVSGMIKNCIMKGSYDEIEIEIEDLVRNCNYSIPFNIAIIIDDERLVININETFEVI